MFNKNKTIFNVAQNLKNDKRKISQTVRICKILSKRYVFENIRTEIAGLGGRKGKDRTPFRPPRLACPTEAVRRREAEAKRTISSFSRAVARKENHN
jgi:hypothetical protein